MTFADPCMFPGIFIAFSVPVVRVIEASHTGGVRVAAPAPNAC